MRALNVRVATILGSAAVCLGDLGCGGAGNVTAPSAPALTLSCNVTPTSGVAPLSVSLSVQVSPATATISVEFGDGTSGSAPNVVHVYKTAGSFNLMVNASSGSQQTNCSDTITVAAPPPPPPQTAPNAVFRTNPSPPTGPAPLDVAFNMCGSVDPDGDPLTFIYDFGDGSSSQSDFCRTDHVYASGTYNAKICVTDGQPGHEVCKNYVVQAD